MTILFWSYLLRNNRIGNPEKQLHKENLFGMQRMYYLVTMSIYVVAFLLFSVALKDFKKKPNISKAALPTAAHLWLMFTKYGSH